MPVAVHGPELELMGTLSERCAAGAPDGGIQQAFAFWAQRRHGLPHLSSDGVKDMTHEAKAKAMTRKAKAKAKDLTLRRHLYCNVNINKQQAYN